MTQKGKDFDATLNSYMTAALVGPDGARAHARRAAGQRRKPHLPYRIPTPGGQGSSTGTTYLLRPCTSRPGCVVQTPSDVSGGGSGGGGGGGGGLGGGFSGSAIEYKVHRTGKDGKDTTPRACTCCILEG